MVHGSLSKFNEDDARKWLGRYGTSGGPQLQRMALLSEGQAKVVFAKMAKKMPTSYSRRTHKCSRHGDDRFPGAGTQGF